MSSVLSLLSWLHHGLILIYIPMMEKLLKQWKNCSFRHCNARGKSGNEYHVYVEGAFLLGNK